MLCSTHDSFRIDMDEMPSAYYPGSAPPAHTLKNPLSLNGQVNSPQTTLQTQRSVRNSYSDAPLSLF